MTSAKTSLKRKLAAAAVAVTMMAIAHPSQASTATGTIAVSATVLAFCTVTGTAVAFGNYSSSQLDQSGSIGVVCTNGTTYTVALDAGSGTGATVATRKMTGTSGSTLNYTLYKDSGRSSVWGQTTGTDTVAGTGSGSLQSLNVYGRIAGAQYPGPGVYTDTVTVTLTY